MTDFTKPGYYKMRNGEKAWVAGVVPKKTLLDTIVGIARGTATIWLMDGRGPSVDTAYDLISPWEDPPAVVEWDAMLHSRQERTDKAEEIDVGDYWVSIWEMPAGSISEGGVIMLKKPISRKGIIAIIHVHEWEAILRGDRKLIKGEGLE